MSKKKSRKFSFPAWISALCLGITLGIASQRIPQIKQYTDEILMPVEEQLLGKQKTKSIFAKTHHSPEFHQTAIKPGLPQSVFFIQREGYSLAYDARNRNPAWVYEHLRDESLLGSADRAHFDFKEDEQIPSILRTSLLDYIRLFNQI